MIKPKMPEPREVRDGSGISRKPNMPEPRKLKDGSYIEPYNFRKILAKPFILIAEFILKEEIYYFKHIKK
jgi:hypothetical protein